MLGTRMSNQDEDEVEDELDALEQEMIGNSVTPIAVLPEAPTTRLPDGDGLESLKEHEKVRARVRKQAADRGHAERVPA